MNDIEYVYKIREIKWWPFIFCIVFFSVSLTFSVKELLDPNSNVGLRGFVLEKTAGRVFMWFLFICSSIMVSFCLYYWVTSVIPRKIIINNEYLQVPRNLPLLKNVTVRYEDIVDSKLSMFSSINEEILIIKTKTHKLRVYAQMLPSAEAYQKISKSVAQKKFVE
jgi:hypothetical protein